MAEPRLGAKVRALRRREGLTQRQLAEQLEISPSYLNLIEKNKRPLSANLLIKLAQHFQLDLAAFSRDDDQRLGADVLEVLGDPIFDELQLTQGDVRDLVETSPQMARALLTLYRSFREREAGQGVTTAPTTLPSDEVSDLLQHHMNFFPELEQAAERFRRDARLEEEERWPGMLSWLARQGIRLEIVPVSDPAHEAMRRYDPERKVLFISERLPPRSRHFQAGVQIGLLLISDVLDRLTSDGRLTSAASRSLARAALAGYFSGAVMMPYQPFLQAARAHRYDVELLGHRFRTSFEQVCHRLTTLRRPGAEGVPLHLLRVDIAGNISKRFSGSGIRFARYSGACPRWNVHSAFLTPGRIRRQLSRMPDGTTYFCVARTIRKQGGGFLAPASVQAIGLGCEVRFARELIYADGIDVFSKSAAVEVGVTCRLCPRLDCAQRAFPSLERPLTVDENVRGMNFYAPVEP